MRLKVVVIIILIVILVGLAIPLGLRFYHANRDVDSLKDRAQVAADAEKMVLFLEQLIENMEKYGMTGGSAAMVIKTPMNDFALNYQAIIDIKARAELISK